MHKVINSNNYEFQKNEIYNNIANNNDLILFKYNIPHAVSKVDKDHDLIFNNKGRWTFVMPIY